MQTQSISGKADPVVLKINTADVGEALAEGVRDFQRAPTYGLLTGAVCALVGVALILTLHYAGMQYLTYPLVAGFALVCPFLAAGLYEVSRRLQEKEPISAGSVWRTVMSRSELRWVGFATVFVLIVWLYQVWLLMALFLGDSGMGVSVGEFVNTVITTSEGQWFFLIGNLVGAVLAAILFSLTVVSFPLVMDRDVDFVTAMITSMRAVGTNPGPMFVWGIIIVAWLAVAAMTFFVGLIVILPILGHATWHIYRRVVAPEVG